MGSLFAKTTAKGRVLGCDGRLRLRWRERLCGPEAVVVTYCGRVPVGETVWRYGYGIGFGVLQLRRQKRRLRSG